MKQVGDIVRRFRVERDWTLKRLSAYTGIPITTLSKVESNRGNPSHLTLYKLQKAIPAVQLHVEQIEQEKVAS